LALYLRQQALLMKEKIRIFEVFKTSSQWFSISVNSVDFFDYKDGGVLNIKV
jgi:hypothetical protein